MDIGTHKNVYLRWLERHQGTNGHGNNITTDFYVWGLDLSGTLQGAGGIGGLLLWKNDRGTFLYLYDANGNVGQLVNASNGSLAARYEYDPYGNSLVADGTEAWNNPFRYSTKYYDAEIGLYYYGYRYYSPQLGRWPTRDPIEESGGINLYGFVGNEPVNLVDILGLVLVTWKRDGYAYICGSTDASVTDFVSMDTPTKASIAERFGLSVEQLNTFTQNASLSSMQNNDELPAGSKVWVVLTPCGDTNLLARLAYSEGTSENEKDKYAIASVVLNRIAHQQSYPTVSPYASTIQAVIYQTTPGGAYEFNALTRPKWTNSANPAGLQRINDIRDWNWSVKGAEQAINIGVLAELQGATVFHSNAEYGEQEQVMPGQVATRYWNVEYVTQIGGHYYFVITPKTRS